MAEKQKPQWKQQPVDKWTEQDVSDWISSLGGTFKTLQPKFVGMDGNKLLASSLDTIIGKPMLCRIMKKKLKQIEEKNASLPTHNEPASQVPLTIAGFVNQGNTCYLNSAIQALLQTPRLTNHFRYHVNANQHDRYSMTAAWAQICDFAMKNPSRSCTPSLIYKKVVNSHESYSFGAQDDSYFALTSIISQLDEELNTSHSEARYIMSTSSVAVQQFSNKEDIIRHFENRQNPKQSNIIRCLMDGIRATNRTCLQCGEHHSTMYESVRSISLPLVSNAATCDILVLLNNQKFSFQATQIVTSSTILVLKYELQQWLFNQKQIKIPARNIEIGHLIKPNKTITNTSQYVEFLRNDDKWTKLNSTAFAICQPIFNQNIAKNILILSVVQKEENCRLLYQYQSLPISGKIPGVTCL